jgi:hypothetical protein
MRGARLDRLPSRIKGRASLLRRLRALTIAAHRFARGRAYAPDDRHFAILLLDGLTTTLARVDPSACANDSPVSPKERHT